MKIAEIKEIAVAKGIEKPKSKKKDLIREIQAVEGNRSCFSLDIADFCGQNRCLWRQDCT